jgi:two-component system cell cycle sensor histidine kinase/response regulator CckA
MQKKILLVDDDRVLCKYLTNLLTREGHAVTAVDDGIEALDLLTDYSPDIIFLDLILPKINGDKLCQVVRKMEHLKNCYLVIISGVVAEMDIDQAQIGADSYIAKGPFAIMAEHVLEAVKASDSPSRDGAGKHVMGLDAIFPRQLTRELLTRNQHLETILESMGEGILELWEGKIVYANSAAISLFETPQEKLLTRYPADLFGDTMRTRVEAFLQGSRNASSEIGEQMPIELENRLVTLKHVPVQPEPSSSILLIKDITERKRLELQLQHAQKMEAIGTITSGVAHNFRNTLTGILVNSQIIAENHPDDTGLRELVERINTSVKRGAQLVERLLQFSRKQTKKEFQRIDLVAVIAETYPIIRKAFDQKIDIRLNLKQSVPIMGDHSGLSQILMNLFTNARDAMPGGGVLSISAEEEDSAAVVTVSDTGEGMDRETREKCFDPFFTTKEVGRGTGLGLSTTYGIVKSHEGDIQVTSAPNSGCTFKLRFPLACTEGRDDGRLCKQIIRGNGEIILVVEDDSEVQTGLQDLLVCLGYEPVFAATASEALEKYDKYRPGAVLMDISLPEMNGLTCVERIIDMDRVAQIAILSGYDSNGLNGISQRVRSLIKGYLVKPVNAGQLSQLLAKMCGEGAGLNA